MSNRNSSTRSQLTSASGTSNRTAKSSFKTGNGRCNRKYIFSDLKTCSFTWSWSINGLSDINSPLRKLPSAVFSSADDDLQWHLELSGYSSSPPSISILLKFDHENGFFKKYNAISGDAELFIMRPGVGNIENKKKKFEIQNTGNTQVLPGIRFLDLFVHNSWQNYEILQSKLHILCQVSYVTSEKETRENPICSSSLSDDLENLLSDKEFCDVIIKVKGKEYPVHKAILVARSPVFKAMFRESNGMIENTTNVVNISDLSPEVIEEMLLFIYTGKVKNLEKLAYELLPAADKYELKELMEICEENLREQLSKDNVINILILAHDHHANWLKTKALKFIKLHSRPADLKGSKIWDVLTSYRDLTKDVLAVLLEK